MKKINIILILFISVFVLYSQSYIQKKDLVITREQVVDDIVIVDSSLSLHGQVYGTVYAVNSSVYISGSAAVMEKIVIFGGRVYINSDSSGPYIGGEINIYGSHVEVNGSSSESIDILKKKYDLDYSEEVKNWQLDFLRKYLIFDRVIPRIGRKPGDISTGFAEAFGYSLKEKNLGQVVKIRNLAELNLVGSVKTGRNVYYENDLYELYLGMFELNSINDADLLWEKLAEIPEERLNHSCNMSIGDGAHWNFRYKNQLVLMWYRKNWFFIETLSFRESGSHSKIEWDMLEDMRNKILKKFKESIVY